MNNEPELTEERIKKAWDWDVGLQLQDVVCGVVCVQHAGERQVLCAQRRADKSYPLKWSLPGGKVEAGESFVEACVREWQEELGVMPAFELEPFMVREFATYRLHYMRATSYSGRLQNLDNCPALQWVGRSAVRTLDFLPDDYVVARRVLHLCNAHLDYKTITNAQGAALPVHLYCLRQHYHMGQHRAKFATEKVFWK